METNSDLSDVLSSNYMLASLTVRTWSARKTDREATEDLLTQKGAASNAASVVKSLLAGNDKELKDTQAAYARIRTWFYANSLPWTADSEGAQRGSRLVGTEQALAFLRDFANLKSDAEEARDKFLSVYDSAVANASASLGSLYDASQYPSKEQVRTLFGSTLDIVPMPNVADFDRVSIPGAMAQGLKARYAKAAEAHVERAVMDAQERIADELNRMITQMDKVVCGEPVRLHKSLITTMETVAGLAKSLGPVCPELEDIADQIKEKLLQHNVDAYKGNAALAGRASDAAVEILSKLQPKEPKDSEPSAPEVEEGTRDLVSSESDALDDYDTDSVFY